MEVTLISCSAQSLLKNSRVKCNDLISITGECVEYHLAKDCRRATIAA